MSSLDYLDLCRLCLVKDRVSVPIFGGEGNDLFLKIAACLPVKVGREDKLPKKICDDCVYKVELLYEFWNTTANAEKRLLQWLGEVNVEGGKQGYVPNVLNPNVMKQEQSTENRLDGSVMQQVGEHQNNMGMSMMDNMGLGIPMMIPNTNQQQQITSVPMDTSGSPAQNVQAVPGPSSQTTHNQISQNQTSSTQQEDEEESSEDDENSDDECDGDEGLPVKEESEEDPNSRTIEPTTFVNVSLACDEAGPSGLQQQKITDMPEMPISQSADGDPKTGSSLYPFVRIKHEPCDWKIEDVYTLADPTETNGGQSSEKLFANSGTTFAPVDLKEEIVDVETLSPKEDKKPRRRSKRINLDCSRCVKDKLMVPASAQMYKFRCTMCDFKSREKTTLSEHVLRQHSDTYAYVCEICPMEFKVKSDWNQHMKQEHSITKCFVCGTVFKHHKILVYHVKNQHGDLPHQCQKCKLTLESKESLERHMRWHSDMERRYSVTCSKCGKQIQHCHLSAHLLIHGDKNRTTCPLCGKSFKRMGNLQRHVLAHSGLKPYDCEICGKKLSQKACLWYHRKRFHPEAQSRLPPVSVKKLVNNFLLRCERAKKLPFDLK